MAKLVQLKKLNLVSITCNFRRSLTKRSQTALSEEIRTPRTLTELKVSNIGYVDLDEDHITVSVGGKIEVVIHPKYEFRVRSSDISAQSLPLIERCIVVLSKKLSEVAPNARLRVHAVTCVALDKHSHASVLRLLARTQANQPNAVQKNAQVRGVLFRVSTQASVGMNSTDHLDIIIDKEMRARNVQKGFVADQLVQSLRVASELIA